MNHVNLIGKITSQPEVYQSKSGKRTARFNLSTEESYLDTKGNVKKRNYQHTITAWGIWVNLLEEKIEKGTSLAVEGRLISRFYIDKDGSKKKSTEVEINDLIIL
ncbi:MAG: single-stranded DNA-binding protein [Flavobacteriia bacterium]|nr:single-stranded DNA-binding protein [Flavobacteriia bacterium]